MRSRATKPRKQRPPKESCRPAERRDRGASGRNQQAPKTPQDAFTNIFDNRPVGIFLCTVPGGELLRVNEYGARMFGYSSTEEFLALGKEMEQRVFVPGEHRQELLRRVLDCRDFVRAEVHYRRKDGSF